MSVKRTIVGALSVLTLSTVGLGLTGGVANASPASSYCVSHLQGVAVYDDDRPGYVTCYTDSVTWTHAPGLRTYEWYLN
jgi:hypothetical protein